MRARSSDDPIVVYEGGTVKSPASTSPDIRRSVGNFSLQDADARYVDAIHRGDTQTAVGMLLDKAQNTEGIVPRTRGSNRKGRKDRRSGRGTKGRRSDAAVRSRRREKEDRRFLRSGGPLLPFSRR